MSKWEFLKTLIQKKLCPTCHFGLESIKPRWHIVHSQNPNAMAIWYYQKNWKPKFCFIRCNLWNEPKQNMFSYFVEWNVVTKSLIRNALCIIFVPCFYNTLCIPWWCLMNGKMAYQVLSLPLEKVGEWFVHPILQALSRQLLINWMPMLSLWTIRKLKSMF